MKPETYEKMCAAFVVLMLLLSLYPAGKALLADGKASYCYISYGYAPGITSVGMSYKLYAFRPWREDRLVFAATDPKEVVAHAKLIECEIR